MSIYDAQTAQVLFDQVLDRLANDEQELLINGGNDIQQNEILREAIFASAIAAVEVGEKIEKWQSRQKKRLLSHYCPSSEFLVPEAA